MQLQTVVLSADHAGQGFWHDKHGVTDNEFEHMDVSEFPHIFNYLKKLDPAMKTVSIANWGAG